MSAAAHLSGHSYPEIHHAMLTERPEAAPATLAIRLGDAPRYHKPFEFDASFSRQLRTVLADRQPDMFVFTAYSAIPVADSVRGYYEALGVPCPRLGTVLAQRDHSQPFYRDYGQRMRETDENEIARLAASVAGANVCLIDQYVRTGRTVAYAAQLLLQARAEQVTAVHGCWYHEVEHSEVDSWAISSDHSQFMHSVGVAAIAVQSV